MSIVKNQKIGKPSTKVTLGDPQAYSNQASDHNMNLQTKPARPNKHLEK